MIRLKETIINSIERTKPTGVMKIKIYEEKEHRLLHL
jgi:hypothetical protein